MNLSIVTTTFNSETTIKNFIDQIKKNIKNLNILDHEIIIVDDGSKDSSVEKIKKIKETYKEIKIIELSKNFGHHKAMMTGIEESKKDYIFLIDSDLEENPDYLKIFIEQIKNFDFVYGVQKKRSASFLTNILGSLFYKLFNLISINKIPSNLMTMTLMRENVKNELVKFKEREIFFHGLLHTIGFSKKEILVDKTYKGKSEYTLSRKLDLFFDAVTSFSSLPLKIFFYFGLLVSSLSTLYAIYLLVRFFAFKITVPGFTTITLLILFFGGIIVLGIGILGIYIEKIFIEVKNRPRVIIKDKN